MKRVNCGCLGAIIYALVMDCLLLLALAKVLVGL